MKTAVVTTCVGRWRFLEQAFNTWCRHLPVGVIDEVLCVTSSACSDLTARSARALGMRSIEVELERDATGRAIFHKTRLLNAGVASLPREFDRLLLLDADTLVLAGFAEEIATVPDRGFFGFCRSPLTKRDLAGVLVVNRDDWDRVGGMDERFLDWGAEDLDLRLRLRYVAGLDYCRLATSSLQALAHSDDLRVALASQPDKFRSLALNNWRLCENYQAATGRELGADLVDDVTLQELLGLTDELRQRGGSLVRVNQGNR